MDNVAVVVACQLDTILFDHSGGADLDDLIRQNFFFVFKSFRNSH
jgi:hypothetical protein